MKCFYHNDPDGVCAGFWVHNNVGVTDGFYDPTGMRAITYSQPFPFEDIRPDEQVYIVDYSIEPDEMERLLSITKNVTWIDHHKTAIEKYADFPHEIRGVRYDGAAGCLLTYAYIHHMTQRGEGDIKPFELSMCDDAPLFTQLIADWDVWAFRYGDDTRRFQTAFVALDLTPSSEGWFALYDDEPHQQRMLRSGDDMLRFRDGWARAYMSLGFETEFEGHHCFAVNLGRCNSDYFKSLTEDYDILIPFVFNGTNWTVSLYSTRVDVSEIAKWYGGGGHKGASGFQCETLPFTPNK